MSEIPNIVEHNESYAADQPLLHDGAHGVVDVSTGVDTDVYAKLGSAIDSFMTNPYQGNLSENPLKRATYSEALYDLATSRLDVNLLTHERFANQNYNPVLHELGSMLVSLDHNAGVYYPESDVIELFNVVANSVLDNAMAQEKPGNEPDEVAGFDAMFKAGVEQTFSLDRNVALAMVKDNEGWRVVTEQDYVDGSDFTPIEMTRQDNADKTGSKKYRFRTPRYTQTPDDIYDQPVQEGWFTSEWLNEPSYWSAQLRSALVGGLSRTEQQLQDTTISTVLLTEGGILKGTATAGTDLDTTCLVLADSTADFEKAYQATASAFADELATLPFGLKAGAEVGCLFLDRTTGGIYFRGTDSQNYSKSSWDELYNGEYVFKIRNYEKGIGITKADGFNVFKKPYASANNAVEVSVNVETGAVNRLSDTQVEQVKAMQRNLMQQRQAATENDPDFIW